MDRSVVVEPLLTDTQHLHVFWCHLLLSAGTKAMTQRLCRHLSKGMSQAQEAGDSGSKLFDMEHSSDFLKPMSLRLNEQVEFNHGFWMFLA